MRTKVGFFTFLGLGAIAAGASAQNLAGSDTLFDLITDVVNTPGVCPGASGLVYVGGGSGVGENAMKAVPPTQQVAPMSRALNTAACTAGGATAENMAFALDGISMFADSESSAGCGGIKHGTVVAGNVDWRHVLRVLYAGQSSADSNTNDIVTPVATLCGAGNAERVALLGPGGWAGLFHGTCSNGDCTQLRHAFRRGDLSGTTDTFLTLLALPAIVKDAAGQATATPFCNGLETEDNDPIRRVCDAVNTAANTDQVCGVNKDLGVVLPIMVPESNATTHAIAFNTNACNPGQFDFAPPETGATACLSGAGFAFGQCLAPQDINGNFGCLNVRNNRPFDFTSTQDGRVFNKQVRAANGAMIKDPARKPKGQFNSAYYRLHMTVPKTVASRPSRTCQEDSATNQIACMTQASPCSVGFAGRGGANIVGGGIVPQFVNGVDPTDLGRIRDVLIIPNPVTTYPLARKLFINTLIDFANTSGNQNALATCLYNGGTAIENIINGRDFVTLGVPSFCQQCTGTPAGATRPCF